MTWRYFHSTTFTAITDKHAVGATGKRWGINNHPNRYPSCLRHKMAYRVVLNVSSEIERGGLKKGMYIILPKYLVQLELTRWKKNMENLSVTNLKILRNVIPLWCFCERTAFRTSYSHLDFKMQKKTLRICILLVHRIIIFEVEIKTVPNSNLPR